jgi:hypothetical protein
MESSAALGAPGAVGARLRATASLLQPKSSPASPVRAGLEQSVGDYPRWDARYV